MSNFNYIRRRCHRTGSDLIFPTIPGAVDPKFALATHHFVENFCYIITSPRLLLMKCEQHNLHTVHKSQRKTRSLATTPKRRTPVLAPPRHPRNHPVCRPPQARRNGVTGTHEHHLRRVWVLPCGLVFWEQVTSDWPPECEKRPGFPPAVVVSAPRARAGQHLAERRRLL